MATYMLDPYFLEESKITNIKITEYKEFTEFTSKRFSQEESVIIFTELWQSWSNSNIQQLAIKILSISTSSATTKRNFSMFRFIHNKICNQLQNESVKKLNQLSDEEINCVNEYENQYECENEWNEYDENDYEYDENQTIDYKSELQQYDNNDITYNFSGKDFSNIVKHPDFNLNDVPCFLPTIKKYRNSLPLIPFNGYNVKLNNWNTFLTLKPTRQSFIFPLKLILYHILLNPKLCNQMYFDSSIYSDIIRKL
ncbi:hypothetical protein GLOIN_2v1790098 [Rhizophagus irregularis DAOM 181602=DAOM 197198]|uniref:HAT C-terminal dimerisation domain-containing protein n=1 Tax=Rhizophagus irregularis (strain DAOM 181602 / DAOM 197198 / MUCL 43194) TaxID=747089 RepID=A0A2P4NZT8_RHIID|nr:hypothetical protein GLOIN_2v1790098 [Rhizophagus irregularis DAOM 181602=DAOM 197198]POG58651.1 hypothetical protein GLOIN_2v1790098 [Rhizophagus irregularis DAOM 181602=DAOM 197198]GET51077.1 hypothetical protein GLOIN_2v1790098 [Rhizophagus irregularis DAOM 181602=DAOM 197198]|eukprot:XP_025165517.1 hypothetical protein GLOIN_2v1790098 [Rhizophagus irregularis DAOM 181602=DAOM 197198]